jgi:nucleoside-diphosphate-sugar epimerase
MILITGANGFIGQHLVPKIKLAFPNQKIVCLVYKSEKKHEKIGLEILKKTKVIILKVDLLNKNSLNKIPKIPSIIIHLAASVDTSGSNFQVNDTGTQNLYETLGPLDLKTKFIFISTAAVWTGRKNFSKPITENQEPIPNNQYGRTKLEAEKLLSYKAKQDQFPLTILRLNTVYGSDSRKDKLFGVMKNYILTGSVFSRINWPGKFGIVHVGDVTETIIKICRQEISATQLVELFLISTENKNLQEISLVLHQEMGLKYRPIKIPKFVWFLSRKAMNLLPLFEVLLPVYLYNYLWRLNLAINDVLMAKPLKIGKKFPNSTKIKFVNSVKEVINV